eukprot:Skav221434  [mRNA]  locus=scaffold140:45939:46258:+ [translate_table: standard]
MHGTEDIAHDGFAQELACQDGGMRTEVQLLMEWCAGGSLLRRILKDEAVAIALEPQRLLCGPLKLR